MKKVFKPTYLCVKTHTVTGLKYFCKTVKIDPHSYPGSGKYWLRHLKEHGRKFTTEIVGYFECKDECSEFAVRFSLQHNIVESVDEFGKKIWANCIVENGLDGGQTYSGPRDPSIGEKISARTKGVLKGPWSPDVATEAAKKSRETKEKNGTTRKKGEFSHTPKSIEKIKLARSRQIITPESRKKAAAKITGVKHSEDRKKRQKEGVERARSLKSPEELLVERERRIIGIKNRPPITEETREKLRIASTGQVISEATREKLRGFVVVVNKYGQLSRITKDQYYSQTGPKEEWEYLQHRNKLAQERMRR